MQIISRIAGTLVILAIHGGLVVAQDQNVFKPKLSKSSDYNEYWEQQFLFENNELLTSQFLVTNLPLSRHHGIMLASLKVPEKPVVIIKNGRGRKGWQNSEDGLSLSIFTHQLSDRYSRYEMRLANTAAEIDVDFLTHARAVELVTDGDDKGLPDITLYVPMASAEGRWRVGPELTGDDSYGQWQELGSGNGYALHVRQNTKPNAGLKSWHRLTSLSKTDSGSYFPIIHHFVTPGGDERTILLLIQEDGTIKRFDNVTFHQNTENGNWGFVGQDKDLKVEGEVTQKLKLEQFDVADHMSGLEKLVAGSLASIQRERSLVQYSLTVHKGDNSITSAGKALLEDIFLGQEEKNKRRRRRR